MNWYTRFQRVLEFRKYWICKMTCKVSVRYNWWQEVSHLLASWNMEWYPIPIQWLIVLVVIPLATLKHGTIPSATTVLYFYEHRFYMLLSPFMQELPWWYLEFEWRNAMMYTIQSSIKERTIKWNLVMVIKSPNWLDI